MDSARDTELRVLLGCKEEASVDEVDGSWLWWNRSWQDWKQGNQERERGILGQAPSQKRKTQAMHCGSASHPQAGDNEMLV